MLTQILAGEGASHWIVAMQGGAVKWQRPLNDASVIEQAAARLSAAGMDVYFTPAGHSGPRKQTNATAIRALWVDLDCGEGKLAARKGYDTPAQAMKAFAEWSMAQGWPGPSAVVSSGYGLHLYWLLDRSYSRDEWQPVADTLKRALAVGNVYADPSRTADAASLMRLPGTINHKHGQQRPARLLRHDPERLFSLDDLAARLPKLGPRAAPAAPVAPEWGTRPALPLGDAEAIADACKQMGHMRSTRGADMSEPQWWAALSVLSRCENGEHYAHEWSKGDPRYDPAEVANKFTRATAPQTCETFALHAPGHCEGCPLHGTIKSPVQARSAPPAPPSEDKPWREIGQGPWVTNDAGVFFRAPAEPGKEPEPDKRVSFVPVWLVEVRERARLDDEQGGSSLLVEWVELTQARRTRRAVLHQADAHDLRAFTKWLADHNLVASITDKKLMASYIAHLTRRTMLNRGVDKYYDSLGWHDDGFALGQQIIRPDGSTAPIRMQAVDPRIQGVKPKGKLEAWTNALAKLDDPTYDQHAFAVLAGFGSPLLALLGQNSAVISLAGASGAGKTLAGQLALSIYGPPELLATMNANSTPKAVAATLSTNRHVPHLLDEVTNLPPKRLADYIYEVAGGHRHDASTKAGTLREAGSWQLVPFVTTNTPIAEHSGRYITEAHHRRLIELHFNTAMPARLGAELADAATHHCGQAGMVYLQQVARIKDKLPALIEQHIERIRERFGIPSANRFGVWTLAVAYVGGLLAKRAGLITWDVDRIIAGVAHTLGDAAAQTMAPSERALPLIEEWLNEHSQQISTERMQADIPIARFSHRTGQLFLHRTALFAKVSEERIPRAAVKAALGDCYVTEKRARLSTHLPPVWVVVVKAAPLGWLPSSLGQENDDGE